MLFKILLIQLIFLFFSCKQNSDADKAASEFCDCLNANKTNRRESALQKCHDLVSAKYRLLQIYYNTRDTDIYDLYDQKTIDSVNDFVGRFARKVDAFNPPFWLKFDTTSIAK